MTPAETRTSSEQAQSLFPADMATIIPGSTGAEGRGAKAQASDAKKSKQSRFK
jgi:hypothetical protein